MRKIAIALLATSMIGAPVFAASKNQQQPPTNQQQTNQTQQNQQPNQQQAAQDNQTQAPNLPRREIRQVQQALNKDGFKVGRADGRWGPGTENAVKLPADSLTSRRWPTSASTPTGRAASPNRSNAQVSTP